mgnify:CR=1 FL=1
MSDKKTIIINPSSFKVSSFETNTRKNRKKPTERKIKVKSKDKPKNNKTLKRNLIKMIRTHQQQKLKRKSDDYSNKHSEDISVSKSEFSNNDEIVNFKNDKYKFKKSCPLSMKGAPEVDYKNIKLLKKYMSENGKILPSRITNVSQKKQRELSLSIKRARNLALI